MRKLESTLLYHVSGYAGINHVMFLIQSLRFLLRHLHKVQAQQGLRTQIINVLSEVIALGGYKLLP